MTLWKQLFFIMLSSLHIHVSAMYKTYQFNNKTPHAITIIFHGCDTQDAQIPVVDGMARLTIPAHTVIEKVPFKEECNEFYIDVADSDNVWLTTMNNRNRSWGISFKDNPIHKPFTVAKYHAENWIELWSSEIIFSIDTNGNLHIQQNYR